MFTLIWIVMSIALLIPALFAWAAWPQANRNLKNVCVIFSIYYAVTFVILSYRLVNWLIG